MSSGVDDRKGKGRGQRAAPPLDRERLQELALRYASRFATTRAKLRTYLQRKIRERGWSAEGPAPDIDALVGRFADLGYVDDQAFARAKAASLTARGYGTRRVQQALSLAGISEEDSEEAREAAGSAALDAALRFAKRRRLGPYAPHALDPAARQKALAAMIRAGHSFGIARAVIEAPPGEELDRDRLERLA